MKTAILPSSPLPVIFLNPRAVEWVMAKAILFKLMKGFVYGAVIGLFVGTAIYLLAAAVAQMAELPVTPAQIFGLIFGATLAAGVAHEYSSWLESLGKSE